MTIEKGQFTIINQIFSKSFNNSFVLIVETNKSDNINFTDMYLKDCDKIYKIDNDVKINSTIHILVCINQFAINVNDIEELHSDKKAWIDDYISNAIVEIKKGE